DRLQCLGDARALDHILHPGAAAHSGGIDELELAPVALEGNEDAVPRRARLIARDDPLLTEQTVDERGLADIRPADDGNTDAFRGGIRRSRRRLQLEPGESLRHQVL